MAETLSAGLFLNGHQAQETGERVISHWVQRRARMGVSYVNFATPQEASLEQVSPGLFLVGGAVFSSWRFARDRTMLHRAVGNALIAIGAIMPGIGGIVAKTGTIETLYITELTGLIFIWGGYCACVRPDKHSEIPRN